MEVIYDSQNEDIWDVAVYTVHLADHKLSLWISLDQGQGYCQGGIAGDVVWMGHLEILSTGILRHSSSCPSVIPVAEKQYNLQETLLSLIDQSYSNHIMKGHYNRKDV